MSVFTKDYWVKEFPEGYDECFICNETSCKKCPYL